MSVRADPSGRASRTSERIWLSDYAARSCPVKTHNAFDPGAPERVWQPDQALQELFNGGDGYAAGVIGTLVAASGLEVVDLRPLAEASYPEQEEAAARAVAAGVDLVLGARLPAAAGRYGAVDLLIRGADRADGRPGYHAGEIKWHKLHERRTLTPVVRPNTALLLTDYARPRPDQARRHWGYGFRTHTRAADLLQVAHYQRMLQAAGWDAPGRSLAALIGTDDWSPTPLITWIDLDEPLLRTYSRSADPGWLPRSALQRYDHEFGFRLDVAQVARQQTEPEPPAPLVRPIKVRECERCEWWDHCRSKLDPDDVSLRIGIGALDVREVTTLRAHGISTVHQLARADLAGLAEWYLPEVSHRTSGLDRLLAAVRRARMLAAGTDFERLDEGPIDLPPFAVEIDFDIETSADGRVYLWGFLVGGPAGSSGTYQAFARFEDLDDPGELALAREALGWLQRTVLGAPGPVGIFHYSDFELNHLHRLREAEPDPVFAWIDDLARGSLPDQAERGGFVDLLGVVKENFFGARGLGLKVVATAGAGFAWRDDDPGGLNSQRWFADAVHAQTQAERQAARERVLAYNEDDVIATARVRDWLRVQT